MRLRLFFRQWCVHWWYHELRSVQKHFGCKISEEIIQATEVNIRMQRRRNDKIGDALERRNGKFRQFNLEEISTRAVTETVWVKIHISFHTEHPNTTSSNYLLFLRKCFTWRVSFWYLSLKINTTWFDMVFSNAVKFTQVWLKCPNTFWGHCVNSRFTNLSFFSLSLSLDINRTKKMQFAMWDLVLSVNLTVSLNFTFPHVWNLFSLLIDRSLQLKLCG